MFEYKNFKYFFVFSSRDTFLLFKKKIIFHYCDQKYVQDVINFVQIRRGFGYYIHIRTITLKTLKVVLREL